MPICPPVTGQRQTLPIGEPGQLTANKLSANQRFRHSDFVTDFVTDFVAVISSQSDGLGKMAVGIVKYVYDRPSQLIGVIRFTVSMFAVSCRGPNCWMIHALFIAMTTPCSEESAPA